MEATRLQNSTDITNRGSLQGIHKMPYFNSHSGQIVFSKDAAKGAPNLRGEATTFLHFPLESRSTQKAEPLDQVSKEIPRRKMGRLVEAIDL